MELRVNLTNGSHDQFPNTWKYQTTDQGELDVLADNELPIATYAKGQWVSARRLKEADEEWPEREIEVRMKSVEEPEVAPEILQGLPGFLKK